MMKINDRISSAEAMELALRETGLKAEDLRAQTDIQETDDLFELRFFSEWMEYTVYVDTCSGEVVGCLGEPVEEIYDRCEVIPFVRTDFGLAS